MTLVSASKTDLQIGYVRVGHSGGPPKLHVVSRESNWGPISGCGHRLINVRSFKRGDEIGMCGHCARKYL